MKTSRFIIPVILLMIISCTSAEKLYLHALDDASHRELKDISYRLTVVDTSLLYPNLMKMIDGEVYVLTVAWKADASYYHNDDSTGFYNTGNYPIFVTVLPDIHEWVDTHWREVDQDTLRLKQLLGLPPNSIKKVFVEFWVRPQDLVRPCPDAEINDIACDLDFPAAADTGHMQWFTALKNNSFSDTILYKRYPFTGFGYTYDWSPKNKSHRGLSEFVIGGNKNVVVGTIAPTDEYLNIKYLKLGRIY